MVVDFAPALRFHAFCASVEVGEELCSDSLLAVSRGPLVEIFESSLGDVVRDEKSEVVSAVGPALRVQSLLLSFMRVQVVYIELLVLR